VSRGVHTGWMRTDPQTKGLKFVYVSNIQQQQVRGIACAQLFSQFFRLDSPERLGAFVACCSEAELLLYLSHVGPCVRLGLDVGVSVFHTLLCQMNARVLTRETSLQKKTPCGVQTTTCGVQTSDLGFVGVREEKAEERSSDARPDAVVAGRHAFTAGDELGRDRGAYCCKKHHTVWGISNTYAQFRSDGSSSYLLCTQTTTTTLCMLGGKAPCPMTK